MLGYVMSLYASVRCKCYEQGKCSPPPFPDDIYIDENGYPALGLPENAATQPHFVQFREWLRTCCDHPNMHCAEIRIASGAGYYNFLTGLDVFGWKRLPTLRKTLPWPEKDFRPMRPEQAERALCELAGFREHADFGDNTFLVDSASGDVISEYKWDGYGSLHTVQTDPHHDTRIAFNTRGIYIIQRPPGTKRNRVMFQAKRLEQRLLETTALEDQQRVEFVNRNTGRTFVCMTPIRRAFWGDDAKIHLDYPHYLHVEKRRRDASYFDYALEPLTFILQTAIAVGQPVVWDEAW
jgi:hypothetical protein